MRFVVEHCPRRHPETAYRSVGDDGGLVVQPTKSEVQVLNPVGSKVFSLLDGEHTIPQIVEAVMDEFEVPRDEAQKDVSEFLQELRHHGMLVSDDAGPENGA
jgi:hypothetical protein